MKTLFQLSIAILIGTIIATFIPAQSLVTNEAQITQDGKRARIEVEGGVSGKWFLIERVNKNDPNGKGFDPSMTYMISDFKPVVKQLKNGKFLIQFECSICEGLP